MKPNHLIVQWLVLLTPDQVTTRRPSLLGLMLGLFVPVFAGATDFYSYHDGSWFDAAYTWGLPASPGSGDSVTIDHTVVFDSTSSSQSVTVSNLDLAGGTLNLGGPATLGMAGSGGLWSGGTLGGSGSLPQSGTLMLSATNTIGNLVNQNLVRQSGISALAINNGYHFDNLASGSYDLQGDGNITQGGWSGADPCFNNFDLLRKSSGGGNSTGSILFNNLNGSIEVDSGTLVLGAGGTSTNGTFTVSAGAALDLTGGSSPALGPAW